MSNLLEQASLVMIPSGYKEDIVYSVIPTSGAGDLTFTRASNGTRIDSNGNVEVVPWNFIEYSEQFDNATWGKVNATITANTTVAPNGTTTADTLAITSGGYLLQQPYLAISIGFSVTISIYAKTQTNNFLTFGGATPAGTDVYTIQDVGNGWYRHINTRTFTASGTSLQFIVYDQVGTNYIWGAQLNIGSTAKPYFPTTDRLNVPRLTYQNGGGGCPSLLLEKQSTNLILQSEAFNSASWIQYTTGGGAVNVIANAAISPDGTQNADEIQLTRSAVTNDALLYQQQFVGNATYSRTIYLKAARSQDIGKTIQIWSYNGTVVQDSLSVTLTANWQRFDAGTATGALVEILSFGYLSSNTFPTTSGTDVRFYAWGAQGEASLYATSYIPTTSSSATRVADECKKLSISSLIGGTSGTVFFDITTNPVLTSDNYKQFFYYTDSSSNQGYMYLNSGNGIVTNVHFGSLSSSITLSANTRYKIALTYANNDFALYANGVSVATSSSGTPLNFQNLLSLGSYNGTSEWNQFVFNEYIHFPTRLTNSELAQLTGNQNYTINQAYESYGVASESPNCVQP